ncbi:MAG TPA: alpha/beta fold hydrolase, partial [Candidatus Dojkabacteria bacterium]
MEFFRDDFNFLNQEEWADFDPDNDISISLDGENRMLRLSSLIDRDLPFLQLKHDFSALDKFSIEARYRMLSEGFGSGLILSDKQLQPYSDLDLAWDDFILMTWPVGSGDFSIFSRPCPNESSTCLHNDNKTPIIRIRDTQWHKLKFSYSNGIYTVFVDDEPIFVSEITERKVNYIYFGSPHRTGSPTAWPIHELDYLVITNDDEVVPEIEPKVVLVPGLGTSWDIPAMLQGRPGDNWEIPSFVSIYDSLIKSFENAGFVKGDDLLVFEYDWRKPISELSEKLDAFIIGHTDEGQKVDLVGHSMGGLISRIYAQNYGVEKVDQIITAGAPHLGVLDAYGVWEGASVFGDTWWEKASVELATEINKQ